MHADVDVKLMRPLVVLGSCSCSQWPCGTGVFASLQICQNIFLNLSDTFLSEIQNLGLKIPHFGAVSGQNWISEHPVISCQKFATCCVQLIVTHDAAVHSSGDCCGITFLRLYCQIVIYHWQFSMLAAGEDWMSVKERSRDLILEKLQYFRVWIYNDNKPVVDVARDAQCCVHTRDSSCRGQTHRWTDGETLCDNKG